MTDATSAEIRADRDRLADLMRQAAAVADRLARAEPHGEPHADHARELAALLRTFARIYAEPRPPVDWRYDHADERDL